MRAKMLALGAGIAVATAAIVIAAASVLWSDVPIPVEDAQEPQQLSILSALLDNGYPPIGSPDAPIRLVEFGDYQCHFCHVFFEDIEEDVIENYVDTGLVQMYFKDYTIIGPDSITAAHGARCAEEQGRFWEYHDVVYSNWDGENTGWASQDNLERFAAQAGVDTAAWSACMATSEYSDVVRNSNQDGRNLGIQGTPSFFVIAPDGEVINIRGAQPYDVFASVFDDLLEQ